MTPLLAYAGRADAYLSLVLLLLVVLIIRAMVSDPPTSPRGLLRPVEPRSNVRRLDRPRAPYDWNLEEQDPDA